MFEEVLKSIGPGMIVPTIMIAAVGYAIPALTHVHRTRSQQRLEFLGRWRQANTMDDMMLEVTARHLCGIYMPASVIRRVCSTDHCSDGLLELAKIWPLFKYDRAKQSVDWIKPKYRNGLRFAQAYHAAGYSLLAMGAFAFLAIAIHQGPRNAFAWVCGLNALLLPVLAFSSLAKSEAFSLTEKSGKAWLDRLKNNVPPTRQACVGQGDGAEHLC